MVDYGGGGARCDQLSSPVHDPHLLHLRVRAASVGDREVARSRADVLRDQYWARHGAGGILTAAAAAGPAQKPVGTDQLTLGRLLRAAFEALCGVWCVVCGVWCVVCGVRCVVGGG